MRERRLDRGVAIGLLTLLLASLLAWAPLPSVSAEDPPPAARAGELVSALRSDLAEILSLGGRWSSARWSVLAVSLETGDTLFAESPDAALAPASNMKLLTTAAALHHLGPDFRYQTFLLTDGRLEGGRVLGDLVLYGTGDPGISDRFQPTVTSVFEAFADSLLALGVVVVEGDVVGDGSYFEGRGLGEGWSDDDLNDWFAAPSGGLVLGESVFTLRVAPSGSPGSPPTIHTLPARAAVPLRNTAVIGPGSGLRIRREHPSQPILVEGTIAPGGREVWRQMTVQDPAHFAASVLRAVLEERGVRVTGSVRVVSGSEGSAVTGKRIWAPFAGRTVPRVLARHISPPLADYLSVVNKRSHNLLADQIFRTVGRVTSGDGSYAGGAGAIGRFMASAPGVDSMRVAIYDGSGLSSLNRVSAADFVAVTRLMAESDRWGSFWETLPEAGDPRGLRRMARTAAAGNLRAKTGTIERVSALSGMVRSVNGERIAFSIISNQVPSTAMAKRIEDRIGTRLASFERPFGVNETRLAQVESPGDGAEPSSPAVIEETETPPAAIPAQHQVLRGENLSVIARAKGLTVQELLTANPGLSSSQPLQVGQWVTIPGPVGGGD